MKISLKNLNEATVQQVFDQVAEHLLTQNAQSTYANAYGDLSCAYRGNDGLMCAAGCLIADDEFVLVQHLNTGAGWHAVAGHFGCMKYADFIQELQSIHDNTCPENWRADLYYLAHSRGLEWKFDEA